MLQKKQMQALAAELEKTEAEDLVEEVCKEVGSGYHFRYFSDRQCLWMDIVEQQCKLLASVVTAAALCLSITNLKADSKVSLLCPNS